LRRPSAAQGKVEDGFQLVTGNTAAGRRPIKPLAKASFSAIPANAAHAGQGGSKLDRQNVGSETVMTLHEVAHFLRCHESTVYRLAKRGELPAFRLGSEWRFLRSKIEQWITSNHLSASGPS
jgi:excisionase family DNA binding protein